MFACRAARTQPLHTFVVDTQECVLTSVEAECRQRWCVEGERTALLKIVRFQNGWDRLQRWGDAREPVGTWQGVTAIAQRRVTRIELDDKNLRGACNLL